MKGSAPGSPLDSGLPWPLFQPHQRLRRDCRLQVSQHKYEKAQQDRESALLHCNQPTFCSLLLCCSHQSWGAVSGHVEKGVKEGPLEPSSGNEDNP